MGFNTFTIMQKTTGVYENPVPLPTIDHFLPSHLKPSTIIGDALQVENYNTPTLLTLFEAQQKQKTCKLQITQQTKKKIQTNNKQQNKKDKTEDNFYPKRR